MKNYLIIAILCLFTTVNFAQEIIWEKDYPKALKLAEQKNALILIFLLMEESLQLKKILSVIF